jgi:hypothetical protein
VDVKTKIDFGGTFHAVYANFAVALRGVGVARGEKRRD